MVERGRLMLMIAMEPSVKMEPTASPAAAQMASLGLTVRHKYTMVFK